MPGGRPSSYTKAKADEIITRVMGGEGLRSITKDEHMPSLQTVFTWLGKSEHAEFLERYADARGIQADVMAEEILDISDDGLNDYVTKERNNGDEYTALDSEHVQRSKLRVDTRKWLMARLNAPKYGDKISTEHSGPGGGPVQMQTIEVDYPEPSHPPSGSTEDD
jgi:hypothetical protein